MASPFATLPVTTRLSSGLVASIERDRFSSDGVIVTVGGTPQSHVHVADNEELAFEYIRRIGHVIDLAFDAGKPITALHLGAGALTLPRYLESTRPGSRQQVIERDEDLVELIRAHIPWDSRWSLRLRYGDARDTLARLPAGLSGSVDLIVVDIFSGDHTPAHVTTVEFFATLVPLLSPQGVVVVNVVDGLGQRFAKSQAATLDSVFGFVGITAESGVLRGRRLGNLVYVATLHDGIPPWWDELLRLGPHPTSVLTGERLERFIAGTAPTTDADAVDSPSVHRSFLSTDS